MIEAKTIIQIEMKDHFAEGLPWLIGRSKGRTKSALLVEKNGMAGIAPGTRVNLIVPENRGINKSFLIAFLDKYAEQTITDLPDLKLSELVTIESTSDDDPEHRFEQTVDNFSAAIYSLDYFWREHNRLSLAHA